MGQSPHLPEPPEASGARFAAIGDRSSLGPWVAARSIARLAELVAALSLGIDLGFGQPMEHVLRQCLIATRLADRVGLDDQDRAGVYYTALLINVGCHTDAYEQAKWFGDDIAMKSTKYRLRAQELPRGRQHAQPRRIGAAPGRAGAHRRRLRPPRPSRRGGDDRPARRLAGRLAGELGLDDSACDALSVAYEQWDGKGWPGNLAGEDVPIAARIALLAEYVEVANRVEGVDAAESWPNAAPARSSTRCSPARSNPTPTAFWVTWARCRRGPR